MANELTIVIPRIALRLHRLNVLVNDGIDLETILPLTLSPQADSLVQPPVMVPTDRRGEVLVLPRFQLVGGTADFRVIGYDSDGEGGFIVVGPMGAAVTIAGTTDRESAAGKFCGVGVRFDIAGVDFFQVRLAAIASAGTGIDVHLKLQGAGR